MAKWIDITGQRFGMFVAIKRADNDKNGQVMWECVCDCGRVTTVRIGPLRNGSSTGCGCSRRKIVIPKLSHHGMSSSNLYWIWNAMRKRCTNENDKSWKYYGGRGISVCERWNTSFQNFLDDMGEPPPGMTLDRIDVNGDYGPSNCKWSTRLEQIKNRRPYKRRTA